MEERVIKIIEDKLGLNKDDYTLDSKIEQDLGCDSLDAVEIVMETEKEFGISIADDEVTPNLTTVKNWVNFVKQKYEAL